MDRLLRLAMWGIVIGFAVYVVVTRPSVAADAVHAVAAGAATAASATATFLDALIPK